MAQASMECNYDYDEEMIIMTERMMLILLNFQTTIPTPCEFIQLMLYLSDASFDFSDIVNECLNLVYVAMLGKKFKPPSYSCA